MTRSKRRSMALLAALVLTLLSGCTAPDAAATAAALAGDVARQLLTFWLL